MELKCEVFPSLSSISVLHNNTRKKKRLEILITVNSAQKWKLPLLQKGVMSCTQNHKCPLLNTSDHISDLESTLLCLLKCLQNLCGLFFFFLLSPSSVSSEEAFKALQKNKKKKKREIKKKKKLGQMAKIQGYHLYAPAQFSISELAPVGGLIGLESCSSRG